MFSIYNYTEYFQKVPDKSNNISHDLNNWGLVHLSKVFKI
jgi:hypothetical protein